MALKAFNLELLVPLLLLMLCLPLDMAFVMGIGAADISICTREVLIQRGPPPAAATTARSAGAPSSAMVAA